MTRITDAELAQMRAWTSNDSNTLRLIAEVEALQAALREMVDAFWHIRRRSRPQQAAIDKARAALGVDDDNP